MNDVVDQRVNIVSALTYDGSVARCTRAQEFSWRLTENINPVRYKESSLIVFRPVFTLCCEILTNHVIAL